MTTPGAGTYSAGSIFLQVVPSFRNFQRAIQQGSKEFNRAMERGIEQSDGIKKAVEKQLDKVDSRKAGEKLGARLAQTTVKKIDQVMRTLAPIVLSVDADSDEAQRKIESIVERMSAIKDRLELGVDVDGAREAEDQFRSLAVEMATVDGRSVDIETNARVAGSLADLQRLERQVDRLDGRNIDLDSSGLERVLQRAHGASQALRGFNGWVLASAAAGPALVPVLGAIAGGLLAVGSAAAGVLAGGGVLALGLSGIGDAVKALGKQQEDGADQAVNLGRSQRAAARAVRDAEDGIADARRNAAEAAEDAADRTADARKAVVRAEKDAAEGVERALERLADAERDVIKAQRDATRAQQDLRQARADAKGDLADLDSRVRAGALAERQALVDLFEAQVAYNAAQQDGGATNLEREQAAIALERAQIAIADTRRENEDLRAEQARLAREGVDGTERVQAAQENVTAAVERQAEVQERVEDAQQGVAQARVDGADRIAQAQEGLADAQAAQARVAVDGQRAIAEAQEGLADAQANYADAMVQTTATADAARDALDKLSPAGRRFALFLSGLRGEFRALRDEAQEGMLPGFETAIRNLLPYMPQLTSFVGEVASLLGDLAVNASKALTGPIWTDFFTMLDQYAPTFITQFAEIAGGSLTILAQLATAFAPLAVKIGDALSGMVDSFSQFLNSKRGQDAMQDFMGYVERVGPKVVDFLEALFGAAFNLAVGLAPYGDIILRIFTGILNFVAGMPPDVLGAIVFAFASLVFTFQILAGLLGVLGAFAGIMTTLALIFGTTAGAIFLVIGILAVLVIGLGIAYAQSETFRNIVNAAFRSVGAVVNWLWNKVVKPIFNFIVGVLSWTGRAVWAFWLLFWEACKRIGGAIRDLYNDYIKKYVDAIAGYFKEKLGPAWQYLVDSATQTWDDIKTIFAKGIVLVVDTILNKGLIGTFNALAEQFGTPKIDTVGSSWMPDIRRQASQPLGEGRPRGYARGGWTGPGSKYQPAGVVHADEFVIQKSSQRKMRERFPGLLDYINQNGSLPGYALGGAVGKLADTLADGAKDAASAVKGAAAATFDMLRDPVQYLKGKVEGLFDQLKMGTIGDIVIGGPKKLLAGAVEKVKDMVSSVFSGAGGPVSVAGDGELASNAVIAKRLVQNELGFKGTIGGWGRRNNPTEHDDMIGGRKASRALDFMTANLAVGDAIVDLLDPLPITMYQIWQRRIKRPGGNWRPYRGASPHTDHVHWSGYSGGGLVEPTLYDSGGWLQPGITTIMNATGRPEPVFTGDQFEQLVDGRSGGAQYHITVEQPPRSTPVEVAEAVLHAARRINRGGVYAARRG